MKKLACLAAVGGLLVAATTLIAGGPGAFMPGKNKPQLPTIYNGPNKEPSKQFQGNPADKPSAAGVQPMKQGQGPKPDAGKQAQKQKFKP